MNLCPRRRKAGTAKEKNRAKGTVHGDGKRCKARVVGGEVSEDLFEGGLCLPSGTQMTEEDLEGVVNIIKNYDRRNKS